jgi:hypothetical protein
MPEREAAMPERENSAQGGAGGRSERTAMTDHDQCDIEMIRD